MSNHCFFCERPEGEDVVLVATLNNTQNNTSIRTCHRCLNQAARCIDGLKLKDGKKIFMNIRF